VRIIEITVDPRGQARVETQGFTGGEFREASRFLEQPRGTRAGEQLTAEFYQAKQADRQLRQSSRSPA
jgi:hypothetical protein